MSPIKSLSVHVRSMQVLTVYLSQDKVSFIFFEVLIRNLLKLINSRMPLNTGLNGKSSNGI